MSFSNVIVEMWVGCDNAAYADELRRVFLEEQLNRYREENGIVPAYPSRDETTSWWDEAEADAVRAELEAFRDAEDDAEWAFFLQLFGNERLAA